MKNFIILIFFFPAGLVSFAQDNAGVIAGAEALYRVGDYHGAIDACRVGVDKQADDYYLYLIAGRSYLMTGQFTDGIRMFNMANNLLPGSGEYGLASAYALMGRPDVSTEHLERHLRSSFKKKEKEIMLDSSFYNIEKSNEWKMLWRKAWYTDLEKGISEAEYLVSNGREDELAALIDQLSHMYRDTPGMDYLKGLAAFPESGQEGISLIRRALTDGYGGSEEALRLLDYMLEQGQYVSAISDASYYLTLYPYESGFIMLKARALRKTGEREEALNNVYTYLELYPGNAEATNLAGEILFETGSFTGALRYFSANIEKYPGEPQYYINRADVYSATGTWEYAISDYSMSLDLDPMNAGVYLRKGQALIKEGRTVDACRDFRMALKYGDKKASALINRYCIH